MTQSFLNLLKWFAYATITALICLIITVPMVLAVEYFIDPFGMHTMIETCVYWVVGLAGLLAGIAIAVRLGFDVFSIPIRKIDRDAG